jgi:hypothetical protein
MEHNSGIDYSEQFINQKNTYSGNPVEIARSFKNILIVAGSDEKRKWTYKLIE